MQNLTDLNHAEALTGDVMCGPVPPLLCHNAKKSTSGSASVRRQLRKGCQQLFRATYLKAKQRSIASFTFERKTMSIYVNTNNAMAYDIVTSVYISQGFQKRWVHLALDALGEPSFWRECPFLLWHINIFSKYHNTHRSLDANHNAQQNPCPAYSGWAAGWEGTRQRLGSLQTAAQQLKAD